MVKLAMREDQLSIFVAQGQLTTEELTDFISSAPTPFMVWDLSSATLAGMHTEDIHRLADHVAQLGKKGRLGAKSALVCARDVDFGMARMLSIFLSIEEPPVELGVFRRVNDAKAWLLRTRTQG